MCTTTGTKHAENESMEVSSGSLALSRIHTHTHSHFTFTTPSLLAKLTTSCIMSQPRGVLFYQNASINKKKACTILYMKYIYFFQLKSLSVYLGARL